MDIHEKATAALRMVEEADILVYDTETSGLDWKRNSAVGYVIGAANGPQVHGSPIDVMYIPIRHGGGGNLPDPSGGVGPLATPDAKTPIHPFERDLAEAFKRRAAKPKDKGLIVGHHLKFDCHASANHGVMLGRNLSCTQNNEALLDEYSRSFSLDAVAKANGVTAKKGDELYAHLGRLFNVPGTRSAMEHFWRTDGSDPLVNEYACGDGVTTLEVFFKQLAAIQTKDAQGYDLTQVFDIENRLIWTLFRMERRGIKVNTQYLQDLKVQLGLEVDKALKELPDGFNVRSPLDIKRYLTEAGHTNWPTSEKGNPSFTEKWLKQFPEGRKIVAVRKFTNLVNSFITPLLEEHVFEGRVHANINQMKTDEFGTISGRLSCSSPNLQQIPKRDKVLAPMFRKAFEPDEGYLFYERDYSQCEPRLFAHYSKEPALVEGYSADPPRDMHQVVADMMAVERDPTAKRMNMGILTGMQAKTFAGHMGWDMVTATQKFNEWFRVFPGIKDFQDGAKATIINRGYVRSLLGRRGRLEKPNLAYRATSKIIQGGNADIMKYKMVEMDEYCEANGDLVHLLMSVHDAADWQAPDDEEGRRQSAALDAIMVDVQSPPFNLRIPFKVDGKAGRSWAEATFGGDE